MIGMVEQARIKRQKGGVNQESSKTESNSEEPPISDDPRVNFARKFEDKK